MNEKIELRAAAARLLYNDNRDSADYGALVDYIDNSERIIHADWQFPVYPPDAKYEDCDYRPYCTHCNTRIVRTREEGTKLGLEGLVDLMNDMPRCFHCGAVMGKGSR